jgi:hypothetical protein
MEGYGNAGGLAEEDGMIAAIPKNKAEELVEIIRNGIYRDREVYRHREQPQSQPQPQQSSISIADELSKLANLKERGIISEDEFQQMKQGLIKEENMISKALSYCLMILVISSSFSYYKHFTDSPESDGTSSSSFRRSKSASRRCYSRSEI